MKPNESSNRISNVLAWINWTLAVVCLIFFILIAIISLIKIDANWQDKVYALLILFIATLFPAAFFYLNGMVLKSKNSSQENQTKQNDYEF